VKNRFFTFVIAGLVILAVIGVLSSLISNPLSFLKGIAITIGIVVVILLLVKLFYKSSPEKSEQRAFVKAAKRSTKKHKTKRPAATKSKHNPVASFNKLRIRKKSESKSHLTVIEGKKGKKKNRASF
jgi:FtsZ-interacting cell division protein ZipA